MDLVQGRDLLVNLSRTVLAQAQALFQPFLVLHLTVDPDILAARLAERGRESARDIAERLDGADLTLPEGVGPVVTIDTAAPPERLARAALKALYAVRV